MARAAKRIVICLDNAGYEASLECWKIYVALSDKHAEKLGQIRVIEVSLPQSIRRAVLLAA